MTTTQQKVLSVSKDSCSKWEGWWKAWQLKIPLWRLIEYYLKLMQGRLSEMSFCLTSPLLFYFSSLHSFLRLWTFSIIPQYSNDCLQFLYSFSVCPWYLSLWVSSLVSPSLFYLEGQNKVVPAHCQRPISWAQHHTRFSHGTSRE